MPSPTGPLTSTYFKDVTCTSASNCWAVGYTVNGDTQTLAARWNGNSWTIASSQNTGPFNRLEGVTCSSATRCWAVGEYQILNGPPNQTLIEQFLGPLQITSTNRTSAGHFIMSGQTAPNSSVDIQASPDLLAPFVTIDSITADASGFFQYEDINASGYQKRFYRASIP